MMDLRNTRTTVLNQGDANEKREEIRQYFHATYSLDEQLYDTLASESAFYLRPEPLRHPLIFYLGHTAAFYINKLIAAKITSKRINPHFESMFAIGVDEMSWDDLDAAHYDWPTLAEVQSYRDTVRAFVDEVIRTMPLTMPIHWDNPFWVILMGIEHQRIHLETSSVIIRRLPIEQVRQLPLWSICPVAGEAPQNALVPVAGGRVVLGKSKEHPLYGWDNEFGRQENDVWDFSASRILFPTGSTWVSSKTGDTNRKSTGRPRDGNGSAFPKPGIRCSGSIRQTDIVSGPWLRSSTCLGTGRSKSTISRPRPSATGWRPKAGNRSGCRPRPNGTGCAICTISRTSRTGRRRPETSTWSTGRPPAL